MCVSVLFLRSPIHIERSRALTHTNTFCPISYTLALNFFFRVRAAAVGKCVDVRHPGFGNEMKTTTFAGRVCVVDGMPENV